LKGSGFAVDDVGRTLEEHEIGERIELADAVIVAGSIALTGAALRRAHRLRIVSKQGIGVDTVDVATATELGIPVCNTAGSNSESVADHAFALILGVIRQVRRLDAATRSGHGWDVWPPPIEQIAGKTIAIIGTGNVGSRVARRASAGFGMKVLASDLVPNRGLEAAYGVRFAPVEEIVAEADVVTLHVPLTEQTQKMIGAATFERMRPTAILINTARGGIVDENALADALRSGRIAGAGIDVYETEPVAGSPLLGLENVLLTPHSAGQSTESSMNGRIWSAENVVAAFSGTFRNVVNPSALEGPR
jgi:D-3-phosphoglycerate dehydrogenase